MTSIAILIIASYLLGSFPTSYVLVKLLKGIDIRKYGSGNAGATNVYRIAGKWPALFTVLADMAKGFVPVFFFVPWLSAGAPLSIIWLKILAGWAAFAGHILTIFFRNFKGGKGVATGAGVLLAFAPIPMVIGVIGFILVVIKTRYVSLGSMIGAFLIPVTMLLQRYYFHVDIPIGFPIAGFLMFLVVVRTHHANIGRLRRGEERKFGEKDEAEE